MQSPARAVAYHIFSQILFSPRDDGFAFTPFVSVECLCWFFSSCFQHFSFFLGATKNFSEGHIITMLVYCFFLPLREAWEFLARNGFPRKVFFLSFHVRRVRHVILFVE